MSQLPPTTAVPAAPLPSSALVSLPRMSRDFC